MLRLFKREHAPLIKTLNSLLTYFETTYNLANMLNHFHKILQKLFFFCFSKLVKAFLGKGGLVKYLKLTVLKQISYTII